MAGVLSYIASGRVQAVTASALCAVASLKLPPLSYLSGAVIGVMTLRYGVTEGALMVAGSSVAGALMCWWLLGTMAPALAFAVATWLPVWLLAQVLRSTASQGAMLTGALLLGALMVLGFHLVLGDSALWWREVMSLVVADVVDGAELALDASQESQLAAIVELLSRHMTGLVAAGTVLGLAVTVMLARAWQAALDNPGGFGREFRALALPRKVGLAAATLLAVALFANAATGGVAGDLMWSLVMVYLLQGLAVVHALVAGRARAGMWLFGVYVLLGLLPVQGVTLVALIGYADEWLGLRRRYARAAG